MLINLKLNLKSKVHSVTLIFPGLANDQCLRYMPVKNDREIYCKKHLSDAAFSLIIFSFI